MLITISKTQQATQPVDQQLYNPKNPGNPMLLHTFRSQSRAAIVIANSKKATAEFYDAVTNKKISRASWTNEMRAYAHQKAAEVPPAPYIFKITVIGWIVLTLLVSLLAYLTYLELKPAQKSEEQAAWDRTPAVGDAYFGRYELAPEEGSLAGIPAEIGFGWFQVIEVEDDTFVIANGTDISPTAVPKDELDSTSFESDGVATEITEHMYGSLRFKALDESVTFYLTDKK